MYSTIASLPLDISSTNSFFAKTDKGGTSKIHIWVSIDSYVYRNQLIIQCKFYFKLK